MPKTYNKVDINGTTYIDLSNDTVSSENLVDGVTAHNRDGASITGSLIIPAHIVNTITTSAGAHTVITGEDGDVEFNVPTNVSHLTNDTGYITGMTILSYGNSTWQNFLDAYNSKRVVYCRASSNSDPATGSQTRLAFMAYVSNETTPTNVEFQYYRSVSTHTASQQGDQVYVYKLTNAGVWSVVVREASVKVAAGGDLTGSYSNGTYTVSGTMPSDFSGADSSTAGSNGLVPAPTSGEQNKLLFGDGDWHYLSVNGDTTGYSDEATKVMLAHMKDNTLIDTTYISSATTSKAGVMSASDKTKLNNSYTKQDIIDMFYPVGTIYETVDTTFNPNTAWGGTWIQIQDKFLLAAGNTYHVGDADGGAASISYTPEGSTGGTKLSDQQIAHGHTYTNPSVTTPTLTASSTNYITSASATSSYNVQLGSLPSGGDYRYLRVATSGANVGRSAPSITSGKTCTVSGGSVANLSGASSTRTTHNHSFTGTAATLDTMPPYTIVNIWKRTA